MKAVLWRNSFLVIGVNSRIKCGNSLLKNGPERWFLSLHQRYDSETLGFGSHQGPPRYCRMCVSFESDECNFHTHFEFPGTCFHFDHATSTSLYDSGHISLLGCHCHGCQMREGDENTCRALTVPLAPKAKGFHPGLSARGCKKGFVSHTQPSDVFGLAHSLH